MKTALVLVLICGVCGFFQEAFNPGSIAKTAEVVKAKIESVAFQPVVYYDIELDSKGNPIKVPYKAVDTDGSVYHKGKDDSKFLYILAHSHELRDGGGK